MNGAPRVMWAIARAVGRRRLPGGVAPTDPEVPTYPEITLGGEIVTLNGSNVVVGEA